MSEAKWARLTRRMTAILLWLDVVAVQVQTVNACCSFPSSMPHCVVILIATVEVRFHRLAHEVASNACNQQAKAHDRNPFEYPHTGPWESCVMRHMPQPSSMLNSPMADPI
eukprot:scaffold113_cov339-Pavlova_lutheri.AAC.7